MHTSGKHRKEDPSPQAQNSSTNSPTSLPVFKGTVRRAKIEDADRIVKHIAAVVATVPENDYIDLKDNELTLSPLPENLKDQRAVWMNHGNPETVRGLIRNPNVYFVVIEDPSGGIVGIGTLDLSTAIISNVYCKT